jgi:hypothetical protein
MQHRTGQNVKKSRYRERGKARYTRGPPPDGDTGEKPAARGNRELTGVLEAEEEE